MYRHIHILVNRGSLRNRYETFQKCKKAIEKDKNLVIFPEGGIWTTDFPQLSPFKDGPFRIAIEAQVPIVPVTIPYNWKIMPLLDFKRLSWHRSHIIFHTPIETKGLTSADVDKLKAQTFVVIEAELKAYFPAEK
jgi:1-acyl-sn-glycerol-3-phosphate acyltransferase